MSKKIFLLVSIVAIASMLLAACAPKAPGTLKVAVLAPLRGAVPTCGVSTRDGALLALKEWNEKGGVLGMTLEGPGKNLTLFEEQRIWMGLGSGCTGCTFAPILPRFLRRLASITIRRLGTMMP